jgi:hypothetical protein
MNDYLIERAIELLQDDKLLADAREGARVNNSAAGCLISLEFNAPRWAAERAVRAALRRLDKETNHD